MGGFFVQARGNSTASVGGKPDVEKEVAVTEN